MNAPGSIAIVGAGVVGSTVAIAIKQRMPHAAVTIYTRDAYGSTHSDAAVARWYAPRERGLLRQLCLDSLSYFEELSRVAESGVAYVDAPYYFHTQAEMEWFLRAVPSECRAHMVVLVPDALKIQGYRYGFIARIPLCDVPMYREYLLRRLQELDCRIECAVIDDVHALAEQHDVVVLCTGADTGSLVSDSGVIPVRGAFLRVAAHGQHDQFSLPDQNVHCIFRPYSKDYMIGVTYDEKQIFDDYGIGDLRARVERIDAALLESSPSIVIGMRARRRAGVRIERIGNIIHCYGHGSSGYSSSWGTAAATVDLIV